jgi:hypothetical protein
MQSSPGDIRYFDGLSAHEGDIILAHPNCTPAEAMLPNWPPFDGDWPAK